MLVQRRTIDGMHEEIDSLVREVREQRGFDARGCLARKVDLINSYVRIHKLSGIVVGVSGGIDSAVVLGILKVASQMSNSPISRIVAVALPFFVDQGAADQDRALSRARRVAERFDVEFIASDLSASFEATRRAVGEAIGTVGSPWADGQLVAYLRTPALYYLSALLTSTGTPAIVCGTTNRDEGSYLGFFGKASDGMVDLQVISDLHKSEVYAIGDLLEVPQTTMNADPTGDVYDGKTHLEMIGAPYDFVELYTAMLCLGEEQRRELKGKLTPEAKAQYDQWSERIEDMHRYNLHKYTGGNPSVHLSVYERAVPGGWREEGNFSAPPSARSLVGEFPLNPLVPLRLCNDNQLTQRHAEAIPDIGGEVFTIDNLLSPGECDEVLHEVARHRRVPVGTNGYLRDFTPGVSKVGSWRSTVYSPELAERVWARVRPFLAPVREFDPCAMTDWGGHPVWRPIGVNPAFRFIWYDQGGELVVHYDAGFNPGDGVTHTLMSLVLYLNDCDSKYGGRTRFIRDSQRHLEYAARDFSDWTREARPEEVLCAVSPVKGRALLFDHRVLHDSEPWSGSTPKVIVRTDILFERVSQKVRGAV
jgi:NAD+ synthetase